MFNDGKKSEEGEEEFSETAFRSALDLELPPTVVMWFRLLAFINIHVLSFLGQQLCFPVSSVDRCGHISELCPEECE